MIHVDLGQVPLLLILMVLLLIPLQWLSLHLGLRATLRMTPLPDRWRLFREFARGHHLGVGGIVLVINIFRKLEGKPPVRWAQRGGTGQGRFYGT